MKYLFNRDINNWHDWSKVYQDREAFGALAAAILEKEGLPNIQLLPCTPGTHFVVRTGELVLKIYAPAESGGCTDDYHNETFGLSFAHGRGVRVSAPVARGGIDDKYHFDYLIMEYIDGVPFVSAKDKMTAGEKLSFGEELRGMTGRMNIRVENFSRGSVLDAARGCPKWSAWPGEFNRERMAFYDAYEMPEQVFVHGDINENNIIIKNGRSYLIDFGDCRLAPKIYEDFIIAAELFRLDRDFLCGYFGGIDRDKLLSICFEGGVLHYYGSGVLNQTLGIPLCASLDELRRRIWDRLGGA